MKSLAVVAMAMLATGIANLQAQTYPSRPITLVVPIAPGGAVDTTARVIAEKLQDRLKQSVVVENRSGAGAMIGTAAVAKAPPDGHTLLVMESAAVLTKWLQKNVPFDVTRDFAPIARLVSTPLVLFAHPTVPANDVKELIAYIRANPGKLSVGTPGVGTPHHLAALMLGAAAKIELTQVPYRGSAPALTDLLAGQVPLIWSTPIAVMPFVEQRKVKALGVSTAQRVPVLPLVPTIAESAVPGFQIEAWVGIAAPAKTPPEVIARVAQAVREVTELADVQKRMAALGFRIDFRGTEEFRELLVADDRKFGSIIREAGIQPN